MYTLREPHESRSISFKISCIIVRVPTAVLMMILMIYLLTVIRLTPGGSSTVHIYTQTVHRTTQ